MRLSVRVWPPILIFENVVCSAVSTGTPLKRFVSVTANITDCRSVATGSIPVRTAKLLDGAKAAFQNLTLKMLVRIQLR
jgi:hypothetical protein